MNQDSNLPPPAAAKGGRYQWLGANELHRRAAVAAAWLSTCCLCPRRCGVNRVAGELGSCQTGEHAILANWGPHFGEERVLIGKAGSGTVFFSGCNLSCVFCQNYELSHLARGSRVSPADLAKVFLSLERRGCANLNLVSPSHVVPAVLKALAIAAEQGLQLPLVYNTGGYESLETLALLDGVVDIYMPDMKYADPEVGLRLSGVPDYPQRNQAAIRVMHDQTGDLVVRDGLAVSGLLVRHLVLPGGLAETAGVAAFLAEEISRRTLFHLMKQYYPCYLADRYPPMDRAVTAAEWRAALQAASGAGLVSIWTEAD